MHLETLLPAIRSLHDLPGLVAALGHQPLWEEMPQEAVNRSLKRGPHLTAVGRTGEIPWLALESKQPEEDAGRLARRMSNRGRICLVLALDSNHRRMALAVGFAGCPRLELDLANAGAEALVSVRRLAALPAGGSLAFAARAADALSAETVGRRFFQEFRRTLDNLSAGLPGPLPLEDRNSLALLQLTRVLFLYFIQAKGWLDGRNRFLAEEVDRCLRHKRKIHRDLLRPLFFGTLNRSEGSRSKIGQAFGSIPFLNGGLFEPHPMERGWRADLPNDLWRDAFDRLFERFHFTVAEGCGHGSIAPDMLGRVFEGVMAPAARHASGTFYTPAALVAGILDTAVNTLVARRLDCGETQAERRLQDRDPAAVEILGSISVLDPAVGSGAFLLGALERLSALRNEANTAARKRLVLQRNLFGVDQSAAAVRLTELRLWLSVIADDPAEQARQVDPLPNLDCLIRQGDSLVDPIGEWMNPPVGRQELVRELAELRRSLVAASGAVKRELVRRLRRVEAGALAESLFAAEESTERDIAECLDLARGKDLFGDRRGLDHELCSRLNHLRDRGRSLRTARRRLARTGEVPWFHYQSHFADVFARGGFDVVVGNPPWLRSESISPELRGRLFGRYRWWRSGGPGYANKPDLAVAFLERSLELATRGGVLAMLVPAKIASAGYGVAARHALASTTTIHAVVNLTGCVAAEFDATVYPMAIVASKTPPLPEHSVRTTLDSRGGIRIKQTDLAGGGPWILAPDRVREVLAALQAEHPRLGDKFACRLGLKTGANRIFLNPPATLEPEVLRWAVRGRDIRTFSCVPKAHLLWTHDDGGRARQRLPPHCAAYVAPYLSQLRERKDYRGGPPWVVFRVRSAIARHRVVWADLARQLVAAALTTRRDSRYIPLNSCYVIAARSAAQAERITACLNSTWLRAIALLVAVPAAGGFARFNARTVGQLPLPTTAPADPGLSILAQRGRAGASVQDELDAAVARHLGLTSTAQNALRAVVDSSPRYRR